MNRTRLLLVLVLVAGFAFIIGSRYGHHFWSDDPAASSQAKILRYICPMHPQYTSDRPGVAPCCGMRLEPVYADGTASQPQSSDARLPAGAVRVDAGRRQLLGVRCVSVEKQAGREIRRVSGRVAIDENRVYRVNMGVDGWIQHVYHNSTGAIVQKGQRLASFYSPEFLSAQQSFLFALGALDRFESSGRETPDQITLSQQNIQQYMDGLRNLGMSEPQIEEIKQTRKISHDIYLTAPEEAFIVKRNVTPGQRVSRADELYLLADLSRVWILADVFEGEAKWIHPGQSAVVLYQGREFRAKVSDVPPQFDADSRTLKVRLDADNPGYLFRPDMFVEVGFTFEHPAAPTIPTDAIIDSGLSKTVYVDHGDGYFEPRSVQTGWRTADRVEITRGLDVGDRVAVDGSFLIDSESRMKAAARSAESPAIDPVCKMEVDRAKANAAGRTSQHRGQTYYFCADQCKNKFDADPAKWVKESRSDAQFQ